MDWRARPSQSLGDAFLSTVNGSTSWDLTTAIIVHVMKENRPDEHLIRPVL
jgi:hypothetical protein